MLKPIHILAVATIGLLCVFSFGCHNDPPPQVSEALPPAQESPPPPVNPSLPKSSQTPLKDALENRFAALDVKGSHSSIPAGTRLRSVTLEDGVATIDVSKEFNALANAGESSESQAMKELRTLLAQFPAVLKMRLTVEGKPFDSQATDWNKPFPVRDMPDQGNADSSVPGRGDR